MTAPHPVATAEVTVDAPPETAFALFTEEIGLWWRRDTPYWNDRDRGLAVRIEPGVGGRFMEVYDLESGTGMEVGRVTAWEPGRRLALTWTQAGWDDGASTELAITFEPADRERTTVRLEHSGFERVPGGASSFAGYDAGWKELLGWFAEHVAITDEYMNRMLGQSKPYTAMLLRVTEKADEPEASRIVWEHGRRNFTLKAQGKLPIICPATDDSDWAGIGIFDAPPDEVDRIMREDPGVQAGVFTYELHPVFGFPGWSLS